MNYYNENDKFAAQWLRNLITAGLIPPGYVDERSIKDVNANDLHRYTQCHFFAGIGGWSRALELAGWPTDRPVWTGSCPCQPFSNAGKRKGAADERHLWPEFKRLIAECVPPVVFGEQVASKDGRNWLSGVRTDLEALGYGVGAADLCAASAGAPHIRQRLWWVADSGSESCERITRGLSASQAGVGSSRPLNGNNALRPEHGCENNRLADSNIPVASEERQQRSGQLMRIGENEVACFGLVNANNTRLEGRGLHGSECASESPARTPGYWDSSDTIHCGDGRTRRIEPGLAPLAHGIPNRLGRLRGYGNAIVPQVAAEFITAFMEVTSIKEHH